MLLSLQDTVSTSSVKSSLRPPRRFLGIHLQPGGHRSATSNPSSDVPTCSPQSLTESTVRVECFDIPCRWLLLSDGGGNRDPNTLIRGCKTVGSCSCEQTKKRRSPRHPDRVPSTTASHPTSHCPSQMKTLVWVQGTMKNHINAFQWNCSCHSQRL